MNDDQQRIWKYLQNNAVGRNNVIKIKILADNLGFPPYGTNNDDVRGLITDMVMNQKLPIGTCKDGAFLFTNEEEREEAARYVERNTKAKTIRNINYYNI